ncbi:protein FLX-like 2 [Cornus florida]|uniref:protein FLX-like 2 n=1 Tax=Cornus florida TaxID=4283 RepID=UPI0028A0F2F1|nr:protein FLX-like 2 [Cornus florida]
MGSKGRMPPPHLRRPVAGPGMVHPDPFGPGIRPPPGAYPPFDMLPPPEVMEQKLAAQHMEMQKLATENQRLASTHGTLRQELATAQHELQMFHGEIGAIKSRKDQQMRGLVEKIGKMEAELQASESVKLELQQARADAQSLVAARQELISKVQQLSQDLQRAQSDVQQIPALMSELESLRQEYQYCRATYDYEKKLYNEHLESLQVMERNYMNMAREVEKLRAELTNNANIDRRAGGPYGGPTGYNENEGSGHYPVGQNNYEDNYGAPQGHGPLPPAVSGGPPAAAVAGAGAGGTPGHVGAQSGPTPTRAGYDAPRGPSYDAQRGPGYDAQRGPNYETQKGTGYDGQRGPGYDVSRVSGYDAPRVSGYDAQRGPGYDIQRGFGYDIQRGPGYDVHRGPGYDVQRGPGFEAQRGPGYDVQRGFSKEATKGAGYDAPSRGAVGPQGQVPPATNAPYGSATPPNRAGSGYEALPHGGNPVRR